MDSQRPDTYRTLSPERLAQLQGRHLASFRSRAGAFILDGFVVVCIIAVVEVPLQFLAVYKSAKVQMSLDFNGLVTLAAIVLYFGLTNYFWSGRTLGKRLFRIRVLSLTEDDMSLSRSIQRALAYSVSSVVLGLGFLQYFRHPNRQTVHDRIAETIVVVDSPDPIQSGTSRMRT